MQDNWLDFLKLEGARLQEHQLLAGGQAMSVTSFEGSGVVQEAGALNWMAALPDYVVVTVGSSDAKKFLQAQFCNDLELLGELNPSEASVKSGGVQLNGYCNPKGRLLALFQLLEIGENDYRMVLPASVAEGLVKRLSMFVLRDDVKVAIAADTRVLAVGGPDAHSAIKQLPGFASGSPDIETGEVALTQGCQVAALPGQRWLLLVDDEVAKKSWKQLAADMSPVGANKWKLSCIEQGEPAITDLTAEKFIPQMLNMQSIDALSFKKGCYPGQEIVARMQYLGKLKKNMHRLQLPTVPVAGDLVANDEASGSLSAGQQVLAGDDIDAGTLVTVALGKDGRYECLAVLKTELDLSTLRLEGLDFEAGAQIAELGLPYTVVLPGCS